MPGDIYMYALPLVMLSALKKRELFTTTAIAIDIATAYSKPVEEVRSRRFGVGLIKPFYLFHF
jgi:hypothetical protein